MANKFNLKTIQDAVSYTFKDPGLAELAFNSSSDSGESNERLIFLGNSLIDLIISDYIFLRFPYTSEKELIKNLDNYKKSLKPADFMEVLSDCICSSGKNSSVSKKTLTETFYALSAAIYRDGGMPSAKRFILPMLKSIDGGENYAPNVNSHYSNDDYMGEETKSSHKPFISDALAPVAKKKKESVPAYVDDDNYKSLLQEFVQKNLRTPSVILKYNTVCLSRSTYKSEVILDGKILASAKGSMKKTAEHDAAMKAYLDLIDDKSDLCKWFKKLSESGITYVETRVDYVSKLNLYFQKQSRSSELPVSYEKSQLSDSKTFCVSVIINDDEVAVGKSTNIKEAKQIAAEKACKYLGIE